MRCARPLCFVMIAGLCTGGAPGQQVGSVEMHFAYFASGVTVVFNSVLHQALRTNLTVINPGLEPVQVEVGLFDGAGMPLQTRLRKTGLGPLLDNPFILPARSSVEFEVELLEPGLKTGQLKIDSNGPVASLECIENVMVFESDTAVLPGFQVLSAVEQPPAQAVSDFAVNVEETPGGLTGLSLVAENPVAPVSGSLTLMDSSGTQVASLAVDLQPGQQMVSQVGALFPALESLGKGTLEGHFDKPMRVAAIRAGKKDNSLRQSLIATLD